MTEFVSVGMTSWMAGQRHFTIYLNDTGFVALVTTILDKSSWDIPQAYSVRQ